ncbi:hypothetical protein KBB89_00155 [Candidatus Gracilibacteria bacterium]|nr:hypothetical protein [Candidatus Gracilibacteria bacterium]
MTELQFDRLETIGDIPCTQEDFLEASRILNDSECDFSQTLDKIMSQYKTPGDRSDRIEKILRIARRIAMTNGITGGKPTTTEEILHNLENGVFLHTRGVAIYVKRIIAGTT